MNTMQAGANIAVDQREIVDVAVGWLPKDTSIDVCAFVLDDTGKVRSNDDFIRQANTGNGFIGLSEASGERFFVIKLPEIPQYVQKIVFAVSAQPSLLSLFDLNIQVNDAAVFLPELEAVQSLILGELYRHNRQWKFRAVGQGFKQDLAFLANRYGAVIDTKASQATASSNAVEAQPAAHRAPLNRFEAGVKMIKELSWAWVFYSLAVFIVTELVLGGIIGKLVIGSLVPHVLSYTIEVVLILTAFFVGGAIIGLLSAKVRVLEPALGAFLCVLLTLSISFFSPYSFMRFSWIKLAIGGGCAFLLAFFGAWLGEKVSAGMGNRNSQEFFGDD